MEVEPVHVKNLPLKFGNEQTLGDADSPPFMSIEDTIGYRNEAPACAVCGKNVQGGGGFARLKHGERMVELCCPLCLETFQKDPDPYVKRMQRIDYFRELSELQRAGTP